MVRIAIAIVENEAAVAQENKNLLLRFGQEKGVELQIDCFENGLDFLESPLAYDVAFLDIDMPGINGMETAKKVREKNEKIDIVFVTNLPQFAIEGYRVRALDFVLKPTNYADFRLAMSKVYSRVSNEDQGTLLVKTRQGLQKIDVKEVLYIEVLGHDVLVHCGQGVTHSLRGALKNIEPSLTSPYFQKINSGVIVNLFHVSGSDGDVARMDDGASLPISRSHKKEFARRLTELYAKNLEGKANE